MTDEIEDGPFLEKVYRKMNAMYHPDFVPPDIKESIDDYVQNRVPLGGFLQAVMANDLCEAVGRADADNMLTIRHIVGYVYNEVPPNAWGSKEKYYAWIR